MSSATSSQELRFQPGETILEEGGEPDGIYIVKQGGIGVYKDDVLIEVFMGKHSVLGEMALILGRTRTASVKARTACVVKFYPGKSLGDVLSAYPEVTEVIVENLASRLDNANEKIAKHSRQQKLDV